MVSRDKEKHFDDKQLARPHCGSSEVTGMLGGMWVTDVAAGVNVTAHLQISTALPLHSWSSWRWSELEVAALGQQTEHTLSA